MTAQVARRWDRVGLAVYAASAVVRFIPAFVAGVTAILVACGDDNSSDTSDAVGTAGSAGSAARSGAGGSGANAATGGSGITAGSGGSVGSAGSSGASGTVGTGAVGATDAGGGSGGAGGTAGSDGGQCVDLCPAPNGGVVWQCQKRFMYGMNYAWNVFAGDFGGISAWGQAGVAADAATHATKLADMRAHDANVIRWWVFPDFRGDGIAFDSNDVPTGLGGTALADVDKALELANQAGVYLMLTLFSFDAFRPSANNSGIWTPGLAPIVRNTTSRTALLENVVRPFARAAASSANARNLIAWDVINEPEWAMTGPSPYGDPSYEPTAGLDALTQDEMQSFIGDVIAVLRAESRALVTVGGAAVKWGHAWTHSDLDFYQLHMYAWINTYWPYTDGPSTYGLTDKPVVMGEFPMGDLTQGVSYSDVVNAWWQNGYAGALSWQYIEATPTGLDAVKAFGDAHTCETQYGPMRTASYVSQAEPSGSSGLLTAQTSITPSLRVCRIVNGRPTCDGPAH